MARDLRADGWARVDLFDEVDSTNVVALDTAERWHLVAAHRQRAGRGLEGDRGMVRRARVAAVRDQGRDAAADLGAQMPVQGALARLAQGRRPGLDRRLGSWGMRAAGVPGRGL